MHPIAQLLREPGSRPNQGGPPLSIAEDPERLRYLGRMVAAVSHELNNRLTGVLGFTDLLAMNPEGDSQARVLGKLRTYAESVRGLVSSLSGFSRSQQEGPEVAPLAPAVRQAVDLANCVARATGGMLTLDIPDAGLHGRIVGPEFRFALYVCLDWLLRQANAAKPQCPVVDVRLEQGASGPLVVMSAPLVQAPGPEESWPSPLRLAERIFSAQHAECGWRCTPEGVWQFVVEPASEVQKDAEFAPVEVSHEPAFVIRTA